MRPREKEICSIVIDHIKDLTGRGPKNIHAKIYEDNIEIHFWLQKNPIENYVYIKHREGERIVTNLYSMALQTKFKTIQKDLNEKLGENYKLHKFDMDIESDKYIIEYKY